MLDQQSERVVRETICFPSPGTQHVAQPGEPEFQRELERLYASAESTALERLLELKSRLNRMPTSEFFSELTEGLSRLLGADVTFVMKRMLVDEHDAAVEMPPIGEPGSCLMAAALHYTTSDGNTATVRESKFHAWGCPCAYMRHDKVFLIPDNLNAFITNNPNTMPKPAEAYLGIPLFSEGKCFAHFGAMWSKEGLAQRGTSWAFTEMLMHSLEDMILDRLLEGVNFVRPNPRRHDKLRLIPHDAVTVAQSLRPYAGSLSHELRTPMQGVVGMLDVMHATVEEAAANQTDSNLQRVFESLKESIEVVQDSSRRAVEAADNVVHAYDMDMSVPDGPPSLVNDDTEVLSPGSTATASLEGRPEISVGSSDLQTARVRKRKRDQEEEHEYRFRRYDNVSYVPSPLTPPEQEPHDNPRTPRLTITSNTDLDASEHPPPPHRVTAPSLRHTSMRQIFRRVISEGLKVGGRPDKAITEETEFGELVEVRSRGSNGTASTKFIEWSVDSNVPASMYIDEKDLTKLVSCVFLNAIKFTDTNDGRVGIHAKMSSRSRYISIRVCDNGPGIPSAFLPRLFKPFSQENASLTRQSEGLGLGLMVAKGIARKLGGDLTCTRADTSGPRRGTEFEIKIPLMAGETVSRPSSPFGSPMPRKAILADTTTDGLATPLPPPLSARSRAASPRRLAKALSAVTRQEPPCTCADLLAPQKSHAALSSDRREHTEGAGKLLSRPDQTRRQENSHKKPSRSIGEIDRDLASKYPLTFLVAEDNKINRKLLVSMLGKLGYRNVYEAHDGCEAVRQMNMPRPIGERVDVILMDLWMPHMDGYEATERILSSADSSGSPSPTSSEPDYTPPTVLAVTADVTDGAVQRAAQVGMKGFMTKPYKILDLQRLITEYCPGAYLGVEDQAISAR